MLTCLRKMWIGYVMLFLMITKKGLNKMEYSRDDLTKAMRWEIAEQLAEDRLEQINKSLDDVKVKDSFYTRHGKRLLDIILSLIAIIITLPIQCCYIDSYFS